jgi:hypothetical protein
MPGPVQHGCALPMQQPFLHQQHRPNRAEPGVRAQLRVRGLPCGSLLLPGLPGRAVEAAQARVQSTGG